MEPSIANVFLLICVDKELDIIKMNKKSENLGGTEINETL